MDRSWYWKAGLIVAVTVAAIYALVPSWTYFRLPTDQRNESGVFEKARPRWAPSRHLNLGLDLQGGIHLVMGVEVDRAVREKAVRRAEELAADLDRKSIKGVEVKGDPDSGIVTVSGQGDALAQARRQISDDYPDMYIRRTGPTAFELAMKDDAVKQLKESAVDQAVKAIRNRVDKWGVSEPTIAKRGDSAILVQLPGYSNPEKAKELIGKTAQLEFKIVDDTDQSLTQLKDLPPGITLDWDRYEGAGGALVTSPYLRAKDGLELRKFVQGKAPPGKEFGIQKVEERIARETYYRTYLLDKKSGMTGEYITDARVAFDNSPGEGNRPYVQVSFNRTGADLFEKLTTANVKKRMAIVLDDSVDSAPTLPGIAGFVLTLGMAVDANVLINERIREEMKQGRSIASAVQTGYDKVFWTIFDGHVTALVAGFVIRAYGSGPVRGFATTLIIGLLASMFTSIVVTRAIVEWFVGHGKLHKAFSV